MVSGDFARRGSSFTDDWNRRQGRTLGLREWREREREKKRESESESERERERESESESESERVSE